VTTGGHSDYEDAAVADDDDDDDESPQVVCSSSDFIPVISMKYAVNPS
jgi:hypothetical protein